MIRHTTSPLWQTSTILVALSGLLAPFGTATARAQSLGPRARNTGQISQSNSIAVAISNNFQVPSPVQPPNVVPLSSLEQVGKDLFFDTTLSNPTGYACATCHIPATGFTAPSSTINEELGTMPGIIPGRFGNRKPQSYAYVAFSPRGPYFDPNLQVWVGGTFWDGRTPDTAHQATQPFLNPNEMANTPVGPYPPILGGYSPLVAQKIMGRPYAGLFQKAAGTNYPLYTYAQIYNFMTVAISAYEASAEINQFSSKYDATPFAVPSQRLYQLTASEENGRSMFFGKAQCSACHTSTGNPPVQLTTRGRDTFTMYCYANIGVPKNPANPYYHVTDPSNPGYNRLGAKFIDYGLGANPNPAPGGMRFFQATPGDVVQFRGLFKAPSVRNVDQRPSSDFVKAYMHNGVFKSLAEVVHFYNKRNIAVSDQGPNGPNADVEVAFDLRVGPPQGFTPLFAPPEVLDNVQNVSGVSPDFATNLVESNGQVGNLELTDQEEADIVAFLMTLTDGFTKPNPVK